RRGTAQRRAAGGRAAQGPRAVPGADLGGGAPPRLHAAAALSVDGEAGHRLQRLPAARQRRLTSAVERTERRLGVRASGIEPEEGVYKTSGPDQGHARLAQKEGGVRPRSATCPVRSS